MQWFRYIQECKASSLHVVSEKKRNFKWYNIAVNSTATNTCTIYINNNAFDMPDVHYAVVVLSEHAKLQILVIPLV